MACKSHEKNRKFRCGAVMQRPATRRRAPGAITPWRQHPGRRRDQRSDQRLRLIESVAGFVTPSSAAVIVTVVLEDAAAVDTVKVADVLPAAIVTVGGTVAFDGLELASEMVTPPAG